MLKAIEIKLLLLIASMLASMVSYAAYEHHRNGEHEKQIQQLLRPMRDDEKAAQPKGWADALKKH